MTTPCRRAVVVALSRVALLGAIALAFPAGSAAANESPPRNPHLAASSYALGHGDAAQQDSVPQAGPDDPGGRWPAEAVRTVHVGPGHFGSYTSGPYPDGRRVLWSNGLDRIVKLDHDRFELLAARFFEGAERYDEARADASIAAFDASGTGLLAIGRSVREMLKFRNLSGVYTLVDADGLYYVCDKGGTITAYGDADPSDAGSEIVVVRRFELPPEVTGPTVGMNMTFDGWLVVATEHGWVVAIRRDFGAHRATRMRHSEGAEDKATGRTGYGWVRNGFPIDEAGGIYVASQEHLHKLVWTGDRLSTDPSDGAWTARYANGWGHGTGATPSLMGFGEEDRFVVLTDGEPLMNVVLFWRDEVPDDWQPPAGAPDRRIAGMRPADMGDPELREIQSEQSVVVAGYGALVVNNMPRNVPWYLPDALRFSLISFLGSRPEHQPYGVQKFAWDPETRRFEEAWVNREVSSPSCVPIVGRAGERVYLIGARDDRWTLEALDWRTGRSLFHSEIGGQRYNPLFSGTLIDEAGRIHYGSPWARIRLDPSEGR